LKLLLLDLEVVLRRPIEITAVTGDVGTGPSFTD